MTDIAATIGEIVHRFTPGELPSPFHAMGDARGSTIIDAVIETATELTTRLANMRAIATGASYADRACG